MFELNTDDATAFLRAYGGAPFHAVLCDPPYGVEIGKAEWDFESPVWQDEFWRALERVLLPGALVLVFCGARTYHRAAAAAEKAGFVINNMMAFAYAGGFFKGLPITPPNAPDAERWRTYRYAVNTLKPAIEPILVTSKPFERNGRHSIRKYGAGAWNIERGRIPAATDEHLCAAPRTTRSVASPAAQGQLPREQRADSRVPANFLLLHNFNCTPRRCTHGCAVRVLDATTPYYRSDGKPRRSTAYKLAFARPSLGKITYSIGDAGTAVRFFYRADWLPEQADPILPAFIYGAKASPKERDAGLKGVIQPINDTFLAHRHNPHPSVKPIKLCGYLSGMLLPPPEYAPRRLLVPFSGVGSEIIGALLAGWDEVVGVEINPEYNRIAELRIKHWTAHHTVDQLSFHSFDTPSTDPQADTPAD